MDRRKLSMRGCFRWTDSGWKGTGLQGQVIYEMHIGTFTPGGHL